ncbi:MAG: hypothetical protein AB7S38_34305 [Vulcanimicrobiota bacterium]
MTDPLKFVTSNLSAAIDELAALEMTHPELRKIEGVCKAAHQIHQAHILLSQAGRTYEALCSTVEVPSSA